MRGIHRWPVNSPHKEPVTRKIFPFDDVIMMSRLLKSHFSVTVAPYIVTNVVIERDIHLLSLLVFHTRRYLYHCIKGYCYQKWYDRIKPYLSTMWSNTLVKYYLATTMVIFMDWGEFTMHNMWKWQLRYELLMSQTWFMLYKYNKDFSFATMHSIGLQWLKEKCIVLQNISSKWKTLEAYNIQMTLYLGWFTW